LFHKVSKKIKLAKVEEPFENKIKNNTKNQIFPNLIAILKKCKNILSPN